MSNGRAVRFLQALGGASTSRVLNLSQIARANRNNPEHAAHPMFLSPPINTAFILKHRMRSDEDYLFHSVRSVATKIIVPFDLEDLGAGGPSIFIDQRGFIDALRSAGHYNDEKLHRDLEVLRLMNTLPSLDPFLLREQLRNHEIEVAPCYFDISEGDQQRMHEFVSAELTRLIRLAAGTSDTDGSTNRMVSALLSNKVDEKLEPLRMTLGLSAKDFREGVFSWRGFLYYKWSMNIFWPDVMAVLREIKETQPHGAVSDEQRRFFPGARRSIIEMVRDYGKDVDRVLAIYNESFQDLVARQTPKSFGNFLLSAPYMFLELGEKMGAISHIVKFWRYRFPSGSPKHIDADELAIIFQDFISSFGERSKSEAPVLGRPHIIEA